LPSHQRRIHKLEEKARKLESKLHKAERQDAVNAERLVDLAAENQRIRQELQEALEEAGEANQQANELRRERDQFHAWWINEVKFSQSLLDNGYTASNAPSTSLYGSDMDSFSLA
jgi:chromosome segregation ATPase